MQFTRSRFNPSTPEPSGSTGSKYSISAVEPHQDRRFATDHSSWSERFPYRDAPASNGEILRRANRCSHAGSKRIVNDAPACRNRWAVCRWDWWIACLAPPTIFLFYARPEGVIPRSLSESAASLLPVRHNLPAYLKNSGRNRLSPLNHDHLN
jgi:hypothetical protein